MTRLLKTLFVGAVIAAAPLGAQAKPDSAKIDITGSWSFTVQSPAGTGTPSVTFKQTGDTLTGTYKSNALGTHEFRGLLKDGKITFEFPAESGGQQFMMSFSGTVESKT